MSQLPGVYPPNKYANVSLELVTLIPRGVRDGDNAFGATPGDTTV